MKGFQEVEKKRFGTAVCIFSVIVFFLFLAEKNIFYLLPFARFLRLIICRVIFGLSNPRLCRKGTYVNMKKRSIAFIITCGLLLSACNSDNITDININTIPPLSMGTVEEESIQEKTEQVSAAVNEEIPLYETEAKGEQTGESRAETASADILPEGWALAVDGDFISEEDITEIYPYVDEEFWSYLVCDGFAYIAEPTGLSFNTAENPELFDSAAGEFKGAPKVSEAKHKRVYIGDTVCGLTVTSASVLFDNTYADSEAHDPYGYRCTSTAQLEGSLTLSGYLYAAKANAPNFDYLMGDVFFIPDGESCKLLPFIGGLRDVDKSLWTHNYNDFYYVNEYDSIICGNIYRDDFINDFSEQAQKEENGLVKAKITISNIKMYSASAISHEIRCRIDEMEILDNAVSYESGSQAESASSEETQRENNTPEWIETAVSGERYVNTDYIYSRIKAVQGSDKVDQYRLNDKVMIIAKTDTDYYKLSDGTFIHGDYLSENEVVNNTESDDIGADYTSVTKNGYVIERIDGITYVDGIMIANKTYTLPAGYDPGIRKEAADALAEMQDAAAAEGLSLFVVSAYRSYYTQEAVYAGWVSRDGREQADTYSSRAGHSDHQTGYTFDLNSLDQSFAYTQEGIWLAEHCAEFGFIIRYPEGKEMYTGYIYEPWHVRYVGIEKAKAITESGLSLEEYYGITSDYAELGE